MNWLDKVIFAPSNATTQVIYGGLAAKWLQILSLGDIGKLRNHLVANPVFFPNSA